MLTQIETLTKQVALAKARRAAETRRDPVSWEPRPLWLWMSFWAFASRDYSTDSRNVDLDLDGWQRLIHAVANAPTDEAALDVLLAWADTAFCGIAVRCTDFQKTGATYGGPSAYGFLRDVATEHRKRTGQSLAVSWAKDADVIAEGRALVLAELTADRASGELLRPDPWERFFCEEENQ